MSIALSPDLLREAREEAGLSQIEAAVGVGVARGTIQNAEAGRFTPHADALARLAHLYGVTLDSLFVHEPEAYTPSNGRGENRTREAAAVVGSPPGPRDGG